MGNFATALKQLKEQALFRFVERFRFNAIRRQKQRRSRRASRSRGVNLAQLRLKLNEAGVPNLWIPKRGCRIESIPVLVSGRLDLGKCVELESNRANPSP